MKRITSFLLAILMLVSLIPADIAYAMGEEKLDVVSLNDGQYMIKLPGVDYTRTREAGNVEDINPTDNPRAFSDRTVKVQIAQMVKDATNVKNLVVTVTCDGANYSKDYELSVDEADTGIKVPVPRKQYFPAILVKFDDGRDSRFIVEAASVPNNVVQITIDFVAHTGVATRWFGNSSKPDIKANFVGLNKTPHKFDLPKVNQNTVLRSPSNDFEWRNHDNIVKLPIVPIADIEANDIDTAKTIYLEIDGKKQGQLGDSKYYYQITGESYTHKGFTATMREKNTVDFDAGDGKWKAEKPAQQFAANGLKLSEKFMDAPDTIGPVTVPNGDNDLTPPAAEAGQPENVFKGWAKTANGPVVDMDTFVVEGDTTFHAIYGPKDQGKVKVEYKDSKTNKPIDSKYQLKGQEYPAEKPGNKDEAIKDEVFDTSNAPKFLGYKIKSITTDPVPNPPATANYTKDGDYTVIYTYDKLDDIIPEKKNGQDNPDVTPEVKEHYAKVTFQVAAVDDAKAKLQLAGTDATSPLVYYVNPLEGKTIAQVADVRAVSKDTNLYKVDANDMWTFKPDTITGTDQVISQVRDTQDNVLKTEITLTAKVADTDAKKYGDKLEAQDIVKWVGDQVDWKDGVKAIDGVTFKNVEDKSSRNTDAAGKFTGKLEVTFQDDSKATVDNQNLFVRAIKDDKVKPTPEDPGNYPTDKVEVKFVKGTGIEALNPENKVIAMKSGESISADDYPAVTVKANFKEKTNKTDYYDVEPGVITENKTTTASTTEIGNGTAVVKFVDTDNKPLDPKTDDKLQIANEKYDQKLSGKDGVKITYDKSNAPKILGYKFTNEDPVINPAKFAEGQQATITLKYEKLNDIIPGTGNTNPDGYVTVMFTAQEGAKLTGETTYFVNPKAGKTLNDITVPTVESTDETKYELKTGDDLWKPVLNKVDEITKDKTFEAQVTKLGEPNVTFPPVEIEKGGSKVVTPDVKDKYNKKIENPGKPEVNEKPNGVTVTPNEDGTVKIEVPKDYTGSGTFTIKVTYKIDGKDVPGEIKVTIKEDKKPEPKPEPVPEVEIPGIKYKDHYTPTYPVYVSVPEKVKPDTLWYIFHIDKYDYEEVRNNNSTSHKMDVTPVIRNERTMLPLRYVAEAIGADVKWDPETRTATFAKDGLIATIQIDSDEIVLSNGKTVKMDSKPLNINDRILVSVVNVGNVFGLTNGNTLDGVDQDIEWDHDTRTATIYIRR